MYVLSHIGSAQRPGRLPFGQSASVKGMIEIKDSRNPPYEIHTHFAPTASAYNYKALLYICVCVWLCVSVLVHMENGRGENEASKCAPPFPPEGTTHPLRSAPPNIPPCSPSLISRGTVIFLFLFFFPTLLHSWDAEFWGSRNVCAVSMENRIGESPAKLANR